MFQTSIKVKVLPFQNLQGFASQNKLILANGQKLEAADPLGIVFIARVISIDYDNLRVEVANKTDSTDSLYASLNPVVWGCAEPFFLKDDKDFKALNDVAEKRERFIHHPKFFAYKDMRYSQALEYLQG